VTTEKADKIVMHYYGWGAKGTGPIDWPPIPEPKKKVKPVVKEEEEEEEEKKEKKSSSSKPDEEEEESDDGLPQVRPPSGEAAPKKPAESESDGSGTYDGSTE
jgi:hypothetical protein